MTSGAKAVVEFWQSAGPKRWFASDAGFDAGFRERFEATHMAAARGEHAQWMDSAEGALALLILLDQFPRNAYRGTAHSYATDGLARQQARRAVASGFDLEVEPSLRMFFYLPFEHSEQLADQEEAMALFAGIGDAELMKYAVLHRDLIVRFGRFPHRNAAHGRESTQDVEDSLANGGFRG